VDARNEQPPVVVETSYGPIVVLVGTSQDFEIDKIRGIRLQDEGETIGDANEATKPVSDPVVLREQAEAKGGGVHATPPEKPLGEQSGSIANNAEKTSTDPSPPQGNISERQFGEGSAAPHPQRGMQNSLSTARYDLGEGELPPPGAALAQAPASAPTPPDPLDILRR
jgi:hypothetical protein